MEKSSQAKIISWNMNHGEICASAARISTTKGNAAEILEKARPIVVQAYNFSIPEAKAGG